MEVLVIPADRIEDDEDDEDIILVVAAGTTVDDCLDGRANIVCECFDIVNAIKIAQLLNKEALN